LETEISIIGLGYIGLPMAVTFMDHYQIVGYDINKKKINYLKKNKNFDKILSNKESKKINLKKIKFTYDKKDLKKSSIYIICVPTPVNKKNKPDLSNLKLACEIVGEFLDYNDIVIFESTVYPGVTTNFCIPILEKKSKIRCHFENTQKEKNVFYCGYSPERVNPGDKVHTFKKIKKIISGSSKVSLRKIKDIYKKVLQNKLIEVTSIEIAEAAKAIENAQRDVNIALINEFSKIFYLSGIDFTKVLNAAKTKWNFLNFTPGLVGGHCIGVDPYYLSHYSQKLGYKPHMILSGRDINESMSSNITKRIINCYRNKNITINNSNLLILGLSFKKNVADYRNSKVFDLADHLNRNKINCYVYDPNVDLKNSNFKYNKILNLKKSKVKFDVIVSAVNHDIFKNDIKYLLEKKTKKKSFIYEIMNIFPKKHVFESL
jgi:UDP-N-acetyl-D-galactosamine dehydrogenase